MLCVGIDVGATKVAAGLVDTVSGEVLDRRRMDTARNGLTVLRDCVGLADELHRPGVERARCGSVRARAPGGNDRELSDG